MWVRTLYLVIVLLAATAIGLVLVTSGAAKDQNQNNQGQNNQGPPAQSHAKREKLRNFDAQILANANDLLGDGRETFRFDTFGDEAFWGGSLKLHQAIKGAALGGVGPGVSPAAALAVGLKVDAEAPPPALVADVRAGRVDLNSPATTAALLKLNAVVGVTGFFDANGS